VLRRIKAIPVTADPAQLAEVRREMALTFAQGDLVAAFPEEDQPLGAELAPFQTHLEDLLAPALVPTLPIALGGGLWDSSFARAGSPRAPLGALGRLSLLVRPITLRVGPELAPGGVPGALRAALQALL
jgi:hypothetical protein